MTPTVRSLMKARPVTIDPRQPIAEAIRILEQGHMRHLPVLEKGRLVGMLSDRDVQAWRQAWLDRRTGEGSKLADEILAEPVSTRMTKPVLTISPDDALEVAAHQIAHAGVGALPVVEGREVVGILSVLDILEAVPNALGAGADTPVSEIMTALPFSITKDESLSAALDVMLDNDVRHIPVVDEENAVVGILSQRDLMGADVTDPRILQDEGTVELEQRLAAIRVAEVMKSPTTIDPDASLAEAGEILLENKFGCLPVVENRKLVGIVTESDYVRYVVQRGEVTRSGGEVVRPH
jgi:CBS domain-containing membrane protein